MLVLPQRQSGLARRGREAQPGLRCAHLGDESIAQVLGRVVVEGPMSG